MVERGVREHHSDERVAGRHRGRERPGLPAAQQHDRPRGRLEERRLFRRHVAVEARGRQIGHQDRERLLVPGFPPAELEDGAVVLRVAGEVISSEPLHGDDPAGADPAGRFGERIRGRELDARAVDQAQPRTARGARRGLGMVPAVVGIAILGAALRAERKGAIEVRSRS